MPGIQLIQNKDKSLEFDKSIFEEIAYTEDYLTKILYQDKCFSIYNSSYPDYPIETWENDDLFVILEGYTYNLDQEIFYKKIIDIITIDSIFLLDNLRIYLENIDGDFIIYIVDKQNYSLTIINDQLKRLPIYYHQSDDFFICSRDLRFVDFLIDEEINEHALIDYLLFMIPAMNDTLHKNIKKLDCASMLVSGLNFFSLKQYKTWNYEDHKFSKLNFTQASSEITSKLLSGMENRIDRIKGDNIKVLLSGGLDSRTIIAMLEKLGRIATGNTFIYPDKSNLQDYENSQEIIKTAGFSWQGFEVDSININNIKEIIKLKDAMNYAGMANMLGFLKEIKQDNCQFYTGDGGRILKNDFPRDKIGSYTDLLNYIIDHKTVYSPKQISLLLDINVEKVYQRVNKILSSYPESSLKYKYLHFLYHERTLNWLQEGEDRNRKYFWSATPFANQMLYDYAKNINPKHKISFNLYKKVLENISAKYLEIDYNDIKQIKSFRYVISDKLKLLLGKFPKLKEKLLKFNSPNQQNIGESGNKLLQDLQSDRNKRLFHNVEAHDYNSAQLYTLASLLEYFK